MESIPVFLCTDNNYAVPTYIALFSLLVNKREEYTVDAFVMATENFTENNTLLLKSLEKKFSFAKIHIVDMENSYESVSINNGHISKATLYRLMIPRVAKQFSDIKMDKCVYIDSDLVIEGDILDLFNIDVAEHYVCGVRDLGVSGDSRSDTDEMIEMRKILGIPSLKNYINGGVLLLNLKAINEKGKGKELEETGYRNDFPYNDQDVINKVLFGGIKTLPLRYNLMPACLYPESKDLITLYGERNIKEARKKPVVVHYIMEFKPWSHTTMYMADKWWKYAKRQEKWIWRDYIRPFAEKNRLPLSLRAHEMARTIAIKMGIYSFTQKLYRFIEN